MSTGAAHCRQFQVGSSRRSMLPWAVSLTHFTGTPLHHPCLPTATSGTRDPKAPVSAATSWNCTLQVPSITSTFCITFSSQPRKQHPAQHHAAAPPRGPVDLTIAFHPRYATQMDESNHESDQGRSAGESETSTLRTAVSTYSTGNQDQTVHEERGEEHVNFNSNSNSDCDFDVDFERLWRHVLAYCQNGSEDTASTVTLDYEKTARAPAHLGQRLEVGHDGLDDPSPSILTPSHQSSEDTASTGALVLDNAPHTPLAPLHNETRGRKRRHSSTSLISTVDLMGLQAGDAPAQEAAIKRRRLSLNDSSLAGTLKEEA
jgi:hypothetical protein